MLTETFLHLPGVGEKRERQLWQAGAEAWEHVLAASAEESVAELRQDNEATGFPQGAQRWRDGSSQAASSPDLRAEALRLAGLRRSAAVEGHAHEYLAVCAAEGLERKWDAVAARLPKREHWRALQSSRSDAWPEMRWLALDIETTGLAPPYSRVTVVGICGHATGFAPVALVADDAGWEERLAGYLCDTDVLVTFNGTGFDVPFLCGTLGWGPERFPPFHVDLCPLWRRLGYKGGLKRVQVQLGFVRETDLAELDGYAAVLLWKSHRSGHPGALPTLVRYCLEDVVVLLPMAREAYDRAAADLGRRWRCPPPPEVRIDHLPFDANLIRSMSSYRHFRSSSGCRNFR